MTKYYVSGEEISADMASAILATNQLILDSGNFEELINCKFVIITEA